MLNNIIGCLIHHDSVPKPSIPEKLRLITEINCCVNLPWFHLKQIDRYQTRTVNIKSRSFLRYPFQTSGLASFGIHWDKTKKIVLFKTCHKHILKSIHVDYIYLKIGEKAKGHTLWNGFALIEKWYPKYFRASKTCHFIAVYR